ncbi:MAG: hypothetical protein NTY86_02570 [Deltaproteobacteria bacterium]|nr:hypothetical protein [Deltaproteobacteria bacterium]
MSSKALEDLTEATREMMECGEEVLADTHCPEQMKSLVRAEMKKQKRFMEIMSDVLNDA